MRVRESGVGLDKLLKQLFSFPREYRRAFEKLNFKQMSLVHPCDHPPGRPDNPSPPGRPDNPSPPGSPDSPSPSL